VPAADERGEDQTDLLALASDDGLDVLEQPPAGLADRGQRGSR